MDAKNRNLLLRVVSALALLPVVLVAIWWGGPTMALLIAAAAAIVASELYGMAGLRLSHPAALAGMAICVAIPFLALDLEARWPLILAALVSAPLLSLSLLTVLPPDGDLRKAAPLAAVAALGPPYAGLCLSSLLGLRAFEDGIAWVLVALVVTWGNDTGAYFAGRLFGRHKLYPLVSPNKTWEGFAGGMLTSIVGCFLVAWTLLPALTTVDCLVIGAVAGVLGPLGDFSESMLKRAWGVKDSGKIMPGHGGLYDRVDALLFNAPWVFAWGWLAHGLV